MSCLVLVGRKLAQECARSGEESSQAHSAAKHTHQVSDRTNCVVVPLLCFGVCVYVAGLKHSMQEAHHWSGPQVAMHACSHVRNMYFHMPCSVVAHVLHVFSHALPHGVLHVSSHVFQHVTCT